MDSEYLKQKTPYITDLILLIYKVQKMATKIL